MRILSFVELRSEKGIPYSKVHLWRLERDGKFPKRVPLGESRHGWLDSEIDDWLAARAAERDGESWEKKSAKPHSALLDPAAPTSATTASRCSANLIDGVRGES